MTSPPRPAPSRRPRDAGAGDYIRWFDEIGLDDVASVGGKTASLGEMTRALAGSGVRLPTGFAVTADAYRRFVAANGLEAAITARERARQSGSETLEAFSDAIRAAFLASSLPADLAGSILQAYRQLSARLGSASAGVAVRSSATAEDLPQASFAGQHESFLGIRGEKQLLDAIRRCFASLFGARAITYRESQGIGHLDTALAVAVQQLVAWPATSSGVIFTLDTETGFPGVIVIEANWGLGESVVRGDVTPDEYRVFKPGLGRSQSPIISHLLGSKLAKVVPGHRGNGTVTRSTSKAERGAFVLDDGDVLTLAEWAMIISRHYGRAMDVEWSRDAATRQLFVVQARPETGATGRDRAMLTTFRLNERREPAVTGLSVGSGIACGQVRILTDAAAADTFQTGEILVAASTSPDLVRVMRRAAGIVTDLGGRTSHAAIVARELSVPAVVGTGAATQVLRTGQTVTVSCAEGSTGFVYDGRLSYDEDVAPLDDLPSTRTKIMINLAIPEAALRWWRLPADGVGLARIEFVIADGVRVHPMALIAPERVNGARQRRTIERLIARAPSGPEYFVQMLAEGIAGIGASQYPKPVIVRLSDFKTNEYAKLLGGDTFEPREENPMIGWRGASRYYDPRYAPAFALECAAIRRAREAMGLDNIATMIPFCRTVEEADRVIGVMRENGLERGVRGLRTYLMCEIPSNVLLAEEFATRFDGFSIGSNDLTQLVLGVDRDSADLRHLFDEQNPAVKAMIRTVITGAHRQGATVGICGQAPSDHPEFAAFLVECGIDSISVNPDSFDRVKRVVAAAER